MMKTGFFNFSVVGNLCIKFTDREAACENLNAIFICLYIYKMRKNLLSVSLDVHCGDYIHCVCGLHREMGNSVWEATHEHDWRECGTSCTGCKTVENKCPFSTTHLHCVVSIWAWVLASAHTSVSYVVPPLLTQSGYVHIKASVKRWIVI